LQIIIGLNHNRILRPVTVKKRFNCRKDHLLLFDKREMPRRRYDNQASICISLCPCFPSFKRHAVLATVDYQPRYFQAVQIISPIEVTKGCEKRTEIRGAVLGPLIWILAVVRSLFGKIGVQKPGGIVSAFPTESREA